MAGVIFKLESPDQDQAGVNEKVQLIQERLKQLDVVEDAEATPDVQRLTGLEVVAAIAIGVQIVGKSGELVGGLRKLISEVKKLAAELGLTNAAIEIGGKQVPIAEAEKMTDEKLQEAAA